MFRHESTLSLIDNIKVASTIKVTEVQIKEECIQECNAVNANNEKTPKDVTVYSNLHFIITLQTTIVSEVGQVIKQVFCSRGHKELKPQRFITTHVKKIFLTPLEANIFTILAKNYQKMRVSTLGEEEHF